MSSGYQYHTLGVDEIRLLQLFAGNPDDDLSGMLDTFALEAAVDIAEASTPQIPVYPPAPPYRALSYCWGRYEATEKLWLAHSKAATVKPYLRIKPNLANALKKLRRDIKPDGYMIIWIDAICINQADTPERNTQIQKMADIYSMAEEVLIWLGDEEKGSDVAMRFAKRIKNPVAFEEALDGDQAEEWLAFRNLILRDWFSRRWIVQEISLAKSATVHCGNESIPWDELEEAVSFLSQMHNAVRKEVRSSKLVGNPVDFLGEVRGMGALHLVEVASNITQNTPTPERSVMEHRMSLEGLMSTLTMFETSDPYDILYGLLWLAHDVKPDAALNNLNVTKTPIMLSPTTEHHGDPLTPNTHSPNEHLGVSQPGRRPRRTLSVSDVLEADNRKQKGVFEKLAVDYDMTLFQCYKTFLDHVFQRSKSLDIICRAWALEPSRKRPEGAPDDWKPEASLPSWMKTLTGNRVFDVNPSERIYERVRADPLVGEPGTGVRPYNACGKRKHEGTYAAIHEGDRTLTARGFELGTIEERDDVASHGNVPESWLSILGWKSEPSSYQEVQSTILGTEDRPNWIWRFLIADRGFDGSRRPPMRFRSICTWLLDHRTRGNGLETHVVHRTSYPALAEEFLELVRKVVWARRLITIRYGSSGQILYGLAPRDVRVGDVVCVLFGCSVPVVLRKSSSDGSGSIKSSGPVSGAPIIEVSEHPDTSDAEPISKKPRLDMLGSKTPATTAGHSKLPVVGNRDGTARVGDVDGDFNGEKYEFVGECYVHGMMVGEAFKHQKDHRIPNRFWALV